MENNDTVRPAVPSPAPAEGEKAFVAAEHLKKSFRLSSRDILVLKDVSFSLPKGEWTALCGASSRRGMNERRRKDRTSWLSDSSIEAKRL